MQQLIKAPDQAIIEAGKNASDEILNQGTLGALVILLTITVGILIWVVIKSKNAHIIDKDKMIDVMNAHSVEVQGLLKDVKNSIDNLSKDNINLKLILDKEIEDIDRGITEIRKTSEGTHNQLQLLNLSHTRKN